MTSNEENNSITHEFDWKSIHQKVNDLKDFFESGKTKTSDSLNELLEERAKEYSKVFESDEQNRASIEIVEFILAKERYGIETKFVGEVLQIKDLTPVPCTPSFILGIINLRGKIISVIDLKKFFGMPDKGISDLNKVIIVQNEVMEFGILADLIPGVSKISTDELQTELSSLDGIGKEFFKGLSKNGTIVLNVGKILSNKELCINEDIHE